MHVIINILFYCKLRNIYGLKWTTTSKRSSPPRGREWRICLNMKVVKWVAAHTGMFIKRSVKTGKIRATRVWSTRFTHCVRLYCLRGIVCVGWALSCGLVFVFMCALGAVHPQTTTMCVLSVILTLVSMICACCCVLMCTSSSVCILVYSCARMCRSSCFHCMKSFCRCQTIDS